MARIVARCPKCRMKYNVNDAKVMGKKMRCRKCQTPFRVKAPTPVADPVEDFESDDYDPFAEFGSDDQPEELPALGQRRRRLKKAKTGAAVDEAEDQSIEGKIGKPLMIAAIAGGSLLMIGMIAAVVFLGPSVAKRIEEGAAVKVPQNFNTFNPQDCSLKLEYPADWEIKYGGGSGGKPSWVRIEHGDISISIRSNLVMSAIGDTGRGIGGGFDPEAERIPKDERPPEWEPVHNIHLSRLEFLQAGNEEYTETPPEVIQTMMGEARISEFVNPESWPSSTTYGYRVTLPPGRDQYFLTFTCPQSQVKPLEQTVWRIVESIAHGSHLMH